MEVGGASVLFRCGLWHTGADHFLKLRLLLTVRDFRLYGATLRVTSAPGHQTRHPTELPLDTDLGPANFARHELRKASFGEIHCREQVWLSLRRTFSWSVCSSLPLGQYRRCVDSGSHHFITVFWWCLRIHVRDCAHDRRCGGLPHPRKQGKGAKEPPWQSSFYACP